MLLDGALKFAHQGREGLTKKNYEQSFTGISSCREIIMELLTTIKPEHAPEICEKVKALYTFMYTQLVEASMERSIAKIDNVIKLLEFERETWVLVMQKVAQERAGTSKPTLSLVGGETPGRGAAGMSMPGSAPGQAPAGRRALSLEA